MFFGTASGLLERIRKRVEAGPIRFLLLDLQRVTGVDSSGVLAFHKVVQLAEASGFEVVVAGAPERVQDQLRRGGVVATEGVVSSSRIWIAACSDVRTYCSAEAAPVAALRRARVAPDLPPHLESYLERRTLAEGTVLIRQGDPPDDLFVLESGLLRVELTTPEGKRIRLSTVRPGWWWARWRCITGVPRTADVIAETPSIVLELSRA